MAVAVAVLLGGYNYALNLLHFDNPLAPGETLETDAFRKEPGLSRNESSSIRAAALFWQFAMNTRGAFITPSRDWP